MRANRQAAVHRSASLEWRSVVRERSACDRCHWPINTIKTRSSHSSTSLHSTNLHCTVWRILIHIIKQHAFVRKYNTQRFSYEAFWKRDVYVDFEEVRSFLVEYLLKLFRFNGNTYIMKMWICLARRRWIHRGISLIRQVLAKRRLQKEG